MNWILIVEGVLFAGVINKKAVEDESDDRENKVNKNQTNLILIR